MASERSSFAKVDLQLQDTVIVKEEPPSSPLDDHRSQTIYSETVVTKEELILDDDYLDYDEEEDDQEEACQPSSTVQGFKCNTCQKSFPQRKMLSRHKLIHYAKKYEHFINVEVLDRDGVIQCTKCKKRVRKYRSARLHFERHLTTKELHFECNICNVQIDTKSQYKKHMANHEKKVNKTAHLKYQCNQCNKGYETELKHKTHLRRHENLEVGKFKCEPCSKPFPSKLELKKHEEKYHKPLHCLKCDILFDSKMAFSVHQCQIQSKKKRLQNPVANPSKLKRMEVKDGLSNSYRKHRSSLGCKTCHETFESKMALQKHVKTHKLEVDKSGMLVMLSKCAYKCKECGQTFESKDLAISHTRRHTSRTHECKICNLRCTDKRCLKMHMETHKKDLKVTASEDDNRYGKLTPELPINMIKESIVVKEEPLPYEIDSTIHQEIIVKNEPVFNDVANEDIPEPSVAEPLEQETSLSFCYETMVKEELIID